MSTRGADGAAKSVKEHRDVKFVTDTSYYGSKIARTCSFCNNTIEGLPKGLYPSDTERYIEHMTFEFATAIDNEYTTCYKCFAETPGEAYHLKMEMFSGVCAGCGKDGADFWMIRDHDGPGGVAIGPHYRAGCSRECCFKIMWEDDDLETYRDNVNAWCRDDSDSDGDSQEN